MIRSAREAVAAIKPMCKPHEFPGAYDSGEKWASTPAKRAAARLAFNKIRGEELAREAQIKKAVDKLGLGAHHKAMQADLSTWRSSVRKEKQASASEMRRFRFRVGTSVMNGFAFMVEGEGDTWDEAVEAMKKSRAESEARMAKLRAEQAQRKAQVSQRPV